VKHFSNAKLWMMKHSVGAIMNHLASDQLRIYKANKRREIRSNVEFTNSIIIDMSLQSAHLRWL
jgi:hypothetical protein